MAAKSLGRHVGRLSVVSATEPLPTPLPPPPRATQASASESTGSQVHVVHMVPPEPHFITRFPTADSTQSQAATSEAKVPERSLLTLPVVASLLVCVCLLCGIFWYETQVPGGIGWKKFTEAVHRLTTEPTPDDELPYITAVPMTPTLGPIETIAETEPDHTTNSEQVLLSDLVADELPTLGNKTHSQRR